MISFELFMQQDAPALLAGLFTAIACALAGSFLVLRRMSLMGDAISHAVLPGIVAAYVLSESLASLPVFLGAAVVGVLTALLSELVHRLGRVEPGASMGVVFTILFSIGVVWLEQLDARTLHLDADCVLYGNLQHALWPDAPTTLAGLFDLDALDALPRAVKTLALVALLNVLFVTIFFKELRLTSFDPALAAAQGYRPGLMHLLLMTIVAVTTVAAFEAVGSILVVAMLIVPGVVAHLLCDRLGPLLVIATLAGIAATGGGYTAGALLDVDAAGMIGVTLGVMLLGVGLFAPRHGWLARWLRRLRATVGITREDMLGVLYRLNELDRRAEASRRSLAPHELRAAVGGGLVARLAQWRLRARDEAAIRDGRIELTLHGARAAQHIVRAHRLWETYLVRILGLRPDHVHDTAMTLEHVTDDRLRDRLAARVDHRTTDPHGKVIPSDPALPVVPAPSAEESGDQARE